MSGDERWDAESLASHLCDALDGTVDEVTEVMEDMRSRGFFFDLVADGLPYVVLVTEAD